MMQKFKNIIFSIIDSLVRNLSGGLGEKIRYVWYKYFRLKGCGANVRIKESVYFYNPETISIGNNVVIMAHTLIDGPDSQNNNSIFCKELVNQHYNYSEPMIKIGNEVQIGAYNLISGLGGIIICDQVTLSARVSLYSSSHLARMPDDNNVITSANSMAHSNPSPSIKSPLVISQNAWLGLNVIMFRGTVGKNSFIKTNSLILQDIPENAIADGNPAKIIGKRFQI